MKDWLKKINAATRTQLKTASDPQTSIPTPQLKSSTRDVQNHLFVTRQEMQKYVAEAVTAAASIILEKTALNDDENLSEI